MIVERAILNRQMLMNYKYKIAEEGHEVRRKRRHVEDWIHRRKRYLSSQALVYAKNRMRHFVSPSRWNAQIDSLSTGHIQNLEQESTCLSGRPTKILTS